MKFPKFADGHTDGQTGKKVTPKDPLRINARDLKRKGRVIIKSTNKKPPAISCIYEGRFPLHIFGLCILYFIFLPMQYYDAP